MQHLQGNKKAVKDMKVEIESKNKSQTDEYLEVETAGTQAGT